MGVRNGGKPMKKLPNILPPRYKSRFNDKLGEFQVKKRFRYTDAEGKTKDTDTKWHLDIESCEKEARERIEGTYIQTPQSKLRKEKTIEVLFNDYVENIIYVLMYCSNYLARG